MFTFFLVYIDILVTVAQHAGRKTSRENQTELPPHPQLLCQSISRSFCWDLWHHIWEGRKWHFAHFWARRKAENNRSSNTCPLRINMSQTGKQSSGHGLIKSFSLCSHADDDGNEAEGDDGAKVACPWTHPWHNTFPVTCVIVNAHHAPPPCLPYLPQKPLCSISCCLLFCPTDTTAVPAPGLLL